MPAYEHHFLPLHPPLDGDSYARLESQGLIEFQTKSGHTLHIRFLCLEEQVRVIAISLPENAAAHADKSIWMKQIIDCVIAAIRLSVDREASPIAMPQGFLNMMYFSDDPEPRYRMVIDPVLNPDYRLDIRKVLGVFGVIHHRQLAPISALLAESQLPSLPPHYQILSLVRALELLYPDEADRGAALDRFEAPFAALHIGRGRFRNALPEIRTRCAHGRSRGRTNPEPFVGIGYNEANLFGLARLLRSIVADGLQTLHGIQFGGQQHTAAS